MSLKQKVGLGVMLPLFALGGGYMVHKTNQKIQEVSNQTPDMTTTFQYPIAYNDYVVNLKEFLRRENPDLVRKTNNSQIELLERCRQNSINHYGEQINKLKEENESLENVPNVTNKTSMNVTGDHQSELNLHEYLKQYHPDIARELNNIRIEDLEQSKQISTYYDDGQINRLKKENASLK